jgi:hypothetical protein
MDLAQKRMLALEAGFLTPKSLTQEALKRLRKRGGC